MKLRGCTTGKFFVITPFRLLDNTHAVRQKTFWENFEDTILYDFKIKNCFFIGQPPVSLPRSWLSTFRGVFLTANPIILAVRVSC